MKSTITTSTTISISSTKPTTILSKPTTVTTTKSNRSTAGKLAKKTGKKRAAKVASSSDTQDKSFQRWMSQEEELLATYYVAVSEDPNIGRDQKMECFWGKDAPEPVTISTVDVEDTSRGNVDLFGQDKRPRPPGACAAKKMKSESSSSTAGSQTTVFADTMQNELRLKWESQQEKDRTVIKFEELRFLATRTYGLSPQDVSIIEMQKGLIRAKFPLL
ncbi:hypothetical protein Tco_1372570 [Tanacetum coccineum]